MDDLVGSGEIQRLLGISRQRLGEIRHTESLHFPAPVVQLKVGSVWRREDVEHWLAGWSRKVGRPKKSEEKTDD